MKPLHEELKEIRLEQDITLEQIQEVTKVHLDFLRRIEDGDFSMVPKPFLRAFLREYAEVVGVDPGRVLLRYENRTDSIRVPKPSAQKTDDAISEERGPADSGSEASAKHKPPAAAGKKSIPEPELPVDSREPDEPPAAEETTSPAEQEEKDVQPSLFGQEPATEENGLPAVTESPQMPDAPASIVSDKEPEKTAIPGERRRLEIEEPGQTNAFYIVGFVIIIIIAAAIIIYINKGF